MRKASSLRATALVLVATTFALAPALADARPGVRGGGASSISRGGGGGGGGGGGYRGGGGGFSGGGHAASRPSGGRSDFNSGNRGNAGSRDRANAGNRAYDGNRANAGNRVNNGNINSGNRNTNINNRNTNINSNVNIDVDNGYGWNDRYHVGGAIVAGAVAGAVVGSMMYSLPSGCSPYPYSGYTYYNCGNVYYETRYEGDKVVYVVVDEPG